MLKPLAFGILLGAANTTLLAQTLSDIQARPDKSSYLQDGRGVIARSPHGLCWRTGDWTPADAVLGCDGELAPPIAKPTAPDIAPAAATQPSAPAPLPVPQQCNFTITLGRDQAFFFNKTVLNDAAKKRIDEEVLGDQARCATIEAITVTGHADQLGSPQYNRQLSEKRAEAVAAYLKSKGVAARIDTAGAADTQPVRSCARTLPRAKRIECLAPNRRVVIEVQGRTK